MTNQEKAPSILFFGALFFILFVVLRAITWLMLRYETAGKVIIPKLLSFSITENTGVAFGIQMAGWITLGLSFLFTVACLVAFCFVLLRRRGSISWALLFMSLGAVSNFYDRIRYGSVIDYLLYPGIGTNNIADYFITVGVGILVIYLLIQDRHARSSQHSLDNPPERRTD